MRSALQPESENQEKLNEALHRASQEGKTETVALLVSSGANLSSLPEDKQTDELKALSNKYQEDIKLCTSEQKLALAKTMNVILVENSHFSLLSDDIISQIGEQQNRIVPNNEVKRRHKTQQKSFAERESARKAEPEPGSPLSR